VFSRRVKKPKEYDGSDPRVLRFILEAQHTDKSFKDDAAWIFGSIKYTSDQCREFWFQAMAIGFEQGLFKSSIQGQQIDLNNSCNTDHQKEFIDKLYKLCHDYNCSIVYHPSHGIIVTDLKPNRE
jgi:hypothetical protein